MRFKTKRLLIVPAHEAHSAQLVDISRSTSRPISATETDEIVRESNRIFREFGVGLWLGQLLDANNSSVGFCAFGCLTGHSLNQVAFAIAPHMRGRGLATELVGEVLNYSEGLLRECDIYATVSLTDSAAIRVLDKLAFSLAINYSTPNPSGLVRYQRTLLRSALRMPFVGMA